MLTDCQIRVHEGINYHKQNTNWGKTKRILIVIWEAGKPDPCVHGPTWASCHCVKVKLVPRWANRSKITLDKHRRTTWAEIMSDELPTLDQRCLAIWDIHVHTYSSCCSLPTKNANWYGNRICWCEASFFEQTWFTSCIVTSCNTPGHH